VLIIRIHAFTYIFINDLSSEVSKGCLSLAAGVSGGEMLNLETSLGAEGSLSPPSTLQSGWSLSPATGISGEEMLMKGTSLV